MISSTTTTQPGLAELVANGDVTAGELVEASIARIEAFDPQINAVIHRQFDRARREAAGSLPDGPFTRRAASASRTSERKSWANRTTRGCAPCATRGWVARVDSPLALRFRSLGFVPSGGRTLPSSR